MPARVNNPRAAEQLRQEYSVLGDRLNLQLDDVVVPVAVIADLTAGSGGIPLVRRAYAGFNQIAVAAEYTVWRLEVPTGVIAVVRRVLVRSPAADVGRVHFGASFAVPPTNVAANTQYMDGRIRGEQARTPAVHLVYDTQAAILAAPYDYMPNTVNPGYDNVVEWLCGRGDAWDFIEFCSTAVNQAILCRIEWDEYAIAN